MNNTIKRSSTTVIYTNLIDTSAGKKGDVFKAVKDAYGWHAQNITTNDTTIYHCFLSMLRNENMTRIIEQY